MKGLLLDVPEFVQEQRRTTGADRFDEVWDGVLHMVPSANIEHQNFEGSLIAWLRNYWLQPDRMVLHQVNVSPNDNWVNNYRIPDIVLLSAKDLEYVRDTFIQGPPTVAIEIYSSGDESYEKLPFYAELGVKEVWIINRDSRRFELHRLVGDRFVVAAPDESGWTASSASGIELRHEAPDRLGIRLIGNDSTFRRLP
jgi:Uma2 family endonuclease